MEGKEPRKRKPRPRKPSTKIVMTCELFYLLSGQELSAAEQRKYKKLLTYHEMYCLNCNLKMLAEYKLVDLNKLPADKRLLVERLIQVLEENIDVLKAEQIESAAQLLESEATEPDAEPEQKQEGVA